jgi:hypothetical protein
LLVSDNFFRPKWVGTGDRRLKNIALVVEWIPALTSTSSTTTPENARYMVGISLAEGETIRRIIHSQQELLSKCALALRNMQDGSIIDASSNFYPDINKGMYSHCAYSDA